MKSHDSLQTRESLLARLKNPSDQEAWGEFFDLYRGLIFSTSVRMGLDSFEAEDVIQQVMITVADKMPGWDYDPAKDSLKGWLLTVTRWKIADQFRQKAHQKKLQSDPTGTPSPSIRSPQYDSESTRTSTVERVADPSNEDWESIWDLEWAQNILQIALQNVRQKADPAHYEIYHLNVLQGRSAREVAETLNVSVAFVHLAKHRVSRKVDKEIESLRERISKTCVHLQK